MGWPVALNLRATARIQHFAIPASSHDITFLGVVKQGLRGTLRACMQGLEMILPDDPARAEDIPTPFVIPVSPRVPRFTATLSNQS